MLTRGRGQYLKVWKGRVLVVARSNGKKGEATVTVISPNLKSQKVRVVL